MRCVNNHEMVQRDDADAQPITFYNFIKNETTVYRKVTLAQFIKVTLVQF